MTAGDPDLRSADPSLLRAFMRYERALMANDVSVLDALFADDTGTIRSDGGYTLVGHEQIAEFRAGRQPPPPRRLVRVHVRHLTPDAAVIVAESSRQDGGTGVQTQVWQRRDIPGPGTESAWVVTAAHVSTGPPRAAAAGAAPGVSPGTWRVPPGADAVVAQGAERGPLARARVAVKDLFAVAGHPIGAGNPAWLAAASIEREHADAVHRLLAAGADVAGIAHTDELAFSLAGTNIHYGAPDNPAAPGRVTGGSTSGPAAAVAAGAADIGLGTDTAGSIRVPASYCGLYGLRTTHDAVDRRGLVGLAPSFDTIGLLTREATLLAEAADILLPPAGTHDIDDLVVVPELQALAEPAVRVAVRAALRALALRAGSRLRTAHLDPDRLEAWFAAFRAVQQAEAWRLHGRFVEEHPGALDPAVEARFRQGGRIGAKEESAARVVLRAARNELLALLPAGTALAFPATSSPAPQRDRDPAEVEAVRAATLRLTCLASLTGAPALSLPTPRVGALPVGLCLVAAPGEDRSLLRLITKDG
ncbi:AtzH-like domain-containing protein [Dactylosporangium sucinum]|uniref:Amidase domain-containing protein n=1 Tax=Dactylosporangium sucinum TaxID=1424081 RepID=A0A917UE99_9ACTN|nr:AtzH-like domain-containing protein [Dactylosporangium sucinum]GGM81459.1 hypothetical protein GCM10007977_098550 [Dactylosporangium sucinum]